MSDHIHSATCERHFVRADHFRPEDTYEEPYAVFNVSFALTNSPEKRHAWVMLFNTGKTDEEMQREIAQFLYELAEQAGSMIEDCTIQRR